MSCSELWCDVHVRTLGHIQPYMCSVTFDFINVGLNVIFRKDLACFGGLSHTGNTSTTALSDTIIG